MATHKSPEQILAELYAAAKDKLISIIKRKGAYGSAAMYERTLLKEIQQELKKLKGSSSKAVQKLVESSYKKGLNDLVKDIQIPRTYNMMSGLNRSQINIIVQNVNADLNKAVNIVGRRCQDIIREIAIQSAADKLTQGQTIRQMQKNLEQKFAKQNIIAVPYANGSCHSIDKYAAMVARTTTAETQNKAKIVQGTAWGYDLVRMTSHYPTCEVCAMYQDRVYALTKEAANGKYKDRRGNPLRFAYLYDTALVAGYDTIHPNCRHRLSILPVNAYTPDELTEFSRKSMLPFEDIRSDAERKAYAKEQYVKRKRNESYRQYQDVKAHLPNDAPKTFAGWQRMKQTNSQRFQDLMEDYRSVQKVASEKEKTSRKNNLTSVNFDIVESTDYKDKFMGITGDNKLDNLLCDKTRDILKHRSNTSKEDMYLIDTETKSVVGVQRHSVLEQEIEYNKSLLDAIKQHKPYTLISIHNHPESKPPSGSDLQSCGDRYYRKGIIGCHNGDVYIYQTGKKPFTSKLFDLTVAKYISNGYNEIEAYEAALKQFEKNYGIRWIKK